MSAARRWTNPPTSSLDASARCAPCGISTREKLEDMDHTVESVLAVNGPTVALLRQNKEICSADANEFSSEVKPYLDSTLTPEGIMAWPLIEEVRFYVTSDILKRGIILVDLPELSNMVWTISLEFEFSTRLKSVNRSKTALPWLRDTTRSSASPPS